MSCAYSFLQSKEAKRSKSLVIQNFCPSGRKNRGIHGIYIFLSSVQESKTAEMMSCSNSFLQFKEAKRKKPLVIQLSARKLSNQNRGNPDFYIFLFFQSKETKSRKPRHIHFLFFNSRIQNRRDHVLPKSLPLIKGNQTEEAMKFANSFLISKEIEPRNQ